MYTFLLCTFLLALGAPALRAQSQSQPVDGYAAEVDGVIVTVGDVIQRIRPALVQLSRSYRGSDLVEKQAQLFEDGLEKLIEQRLMIAHFNKLGGELPPSVLRERKDSIMRERFDNSRENFISALRQIGKTEQIWEDEMREQLITQSIVQQYVRAKINVAPREIRVAYDIKKSEMTKDVELQLRSIAFRPVPESDKQAQLEKMQQVMALLADGADFAATAKTYSEGPKAAQGGYECWVNLSTLPEYLQTGLRDRQPGDLTPLIETPVQSYIFKVEDRRGGDILSLAEAQPLLEKELEAQKYDEIYNTFIQGLYNQFQVRRFNPDISAVTGDL